MTTNRKTLALLATSTLLGLFPGPLRAQEPQPEEPVDATEEVVEKPGAPELGPKEVAARLAKFRTEIAAKMIPARVSRRGQRKTDKWLADFQAIQSRHYLVYTNGPTVTCRKFAKSLENLYGFIKERFPFADPSHHLECYIFRAEEEYFDFCVRIAGWSMEEAQGTAGHAMSHYYATYYQSPTADVVMHEAAHQIVAAGLKVPGVGSWFQEGLAVYIEKKISNGDISGSLKSDLRRGNFYPLARLVEIRTLLSDEHGFRNYEHAGTVIEFLVETKLEPIRGKFNEFLRAARRNYGRGTEITERLFEKVYGLSIAEVEALWKEHFKAPKAVPKVP